MKAKKKTKTKLQYGLECLLCGDKIFSDYRHDFKECKCGNCFIDGGSDYNRVGYTIPASTKNITRRIPCANTKK